MMTTTELETALAHFIGSEQLRFNPLYRWLKYTDGVHFFANKAGNGAYWFLDIVGTELRDLAAKEDFLSVDLRVREDESCEIYVSDGDYTELWMKRISWTDCPVGDWGFFLINNTLMLKQEY